MALNLFYFDYAVLLVTFLVAAYKELKAKKSDGPDKT